jgi:hypothetical protein
MGKTDTKPLEVQLALPPVDVVVAKKTGNKQTAIAARSILLEKKLGFVVPTPRQKKTLVVEFAKAGFVVYGQAFDIVRLRSDIDLDDRESVERNLNNIDLYEIKSTN